MKDKHILGYGFNGFPPSIPDHEEWLLNRETKYKMVIHAEVNAILNSKDIPLTGSTLYVSPLPVCHECAKFVCASGISRVIVSVPESSESTTRWDDSTTKLIFDRAGVEYNVL